MEIKHALVTGGAGFIGSHLVRAYEARGTRVTVLDNLRSGSPTNLDGTNARLVVGSATDGGLVEELLAGVDAVHHFAAVVSVPYSVEFPHATQAVNVGAAVTVLEAARRAGTGCVVLASSAAVYGDVERPIHRESDPVAPANPYGASKYAAEVFMDLYSRTTGVRAVNLRFFNVYGPRQDPKSPYAAAIAAFCDRARAGRPLTIFGDGTQTRDFVYVEDIAAANILAAERGTGTYNVATGSSVTIRDVAETIAREAGKGSPVEYAPPRAGDVMHSCGDASRLRELGWEPGTSLEEGMRRTLAGAGDGRMKDDG